MTILNRYIFRAVVGMTAFVMLVLLALGAFIDFISEQDSIGVGNYGVPEALLYVLLKLPRIAVGLLPVSALLGALLGLGATAYARGDQSRAADYYLRGLSLAIKTRLRQREAALLTNIGILAVSQGELAEAEARLVEALSLARAEGDRLLLGPILTNLGVIAARNRHFGAASGYFEEAVEMARADGNRRGMAFLHSNLGALAHDQGHPARAAREFESALNLSREMGDSQRMSHVLASLGALATARREFDRAESHLSEGLKEARIANLKENEVLLLINSAELQRELGKSERERDLLLESRQLAEAIGHERYRAIASERLARD